MMKIFLITEGGEDIGMGHIMRCLSLSQTFEERGIKPEFIIDGDESVKNILGERPAHLFNWQDDKKHLLDIIRNSHMSVVDSYIADAEFYKRISQIVKYPVYFDDNKRLNYPRGMVINGMVYAEELNYPEKEDVSYLLGTKYMPLRREFSYVKGKLIKERPEKFLVTFGGDDSRVLTPKIMEFLNKNYPEYRKKVTVGASFKNKSIERVEKSKDAKTEIIFNPDAESMKEIMLETDIAISAGGLTLYELARVGVPTIGICVAENQRRNLRGWEKKGFLRYAGVYNEVELEKKIKESIESLKDPDKRREASVTGRNLVDGKGNLHTVTAILRAYFRKHLSLRGVNLDDATELLNLYNDDMVRQNSFNPEKVSRRRHVKWLRTKMKDRNCIFFIADTGDSFHGQVRFDTETHGKEAIINISLKKDARGLGLGSFLINKSIVELTKQRKDIKLIKAYVKKDNMASLRTFERANFKYSGDTSYKGNKAGLYLKEADYAKT